MQKKLKVKIVFLLVFLILGLISCSPSGVNEVSPVIVEDPVAVQVLDASQLPNSENVTFTDSGRMFVANYPGNGSAIYEITKDSSGNYQAQSYVPGVVMGSECNFGGLTSKGNILYGGCMKSGFFSTTAYLFQVNTDNNEVKIAQLYQAKQINGMAVAVDGSVYVGDFSSSRSADIFRLKITQSPFLVQESVFLGKDSYFDSVTPNGIQIEGSYLYYIKKRELRKVKIKDDGTAGAKEVLYKTSFFKIFDDFAISNSFFIVAEIPSTAGMFSNSGGRLLVIDRQSKQVVKTIESNTANFLPSSIQIVKGSNFPYNSAFVTDYFNGGLYIINNPFQEPVPCGLNKVCVAD